MTCDCNKGEKANSYKPLYMYEQPMFMVTVSVVPVYENGVIALVETKHHKVDAGITGVPCAAFVPEKTYKFPGGDVKAGQETLQFAAIRHMKTQLDLVVNKSQLVPIDFRSEPERSEAGNVVDLGFLCLLAGKEENIIKVPNAKLIPVDFEKQERINESDGEFEGDHDILLQRAISAMLVIKD